MASSDDLVDVPASEGLRAFADSSMLVAAALSETGAAYAVFDPPDATPCEILRGGLRPGSAVDGRSG